MGKATDDDRRETWRDWQDKRAPEPPLMTRAEVLELVNSWDLERKVGERGLRYWEKEGLIPRPTLEHRAGVTRTWYPSWAADLIAILRRKQEAKRKLADLRDEMRVEARRLSLKPRAYPPAPLFDENDPFVRYLTECSPHLLPQFRRHINGPDYGPLPTFDPPTLPEWLERLIAYDLAFVIRDQYGRHHFATDRIEVRLLDAEGQSRTFVAPLPDGFRLDLLESARAARSARANLDEGEEGRLSPAPPP